ncbi:MAG: hypothetical protein U1A78_32270 [Polyangia bacterium]
MITSTAFRTDPTSQAILRIGGEEIRNIVSWAASQDVLMIGDPFSVTVPNPRGAYTQKLQVGAKVELLLSNPGVHGGAPALTHTGLVTDRDAVSDLSSGSVIRLQCADRGWHLLNNCPRFFVNGQAQLIEKTTLQRLIQRFAANATWGFADAAGSVTVRADDATSRRLRLGLPPTRAQAQALASDDLIVYRMIVEPGQSVADLLTSAARRLNRLIGVSADGVLQVWNPDYTQKPLYRIDYHREDDPDVVRNNVLAARVRRSLAGLYTRVEVVGQVVGWYPQDDNDLAPGRFSAVATSSAVPFDHELTYAEGEVWQPSLAPYAAQWKLNRAAYDSFEAVYRVRAHHQNGSWWTAGTLCEVHDSVNGLEGTFFVGSVLLLRGRDGDQTEVTLKRPGLLAASFDRLAA